MCKYCQGDKIKYSNNQQGIILHYMKINGNKLLINNNTSFNIQKDFIINYCPMCGRKLKEGTKRWQKMNLSFYKIYKKN